MNTTQKTVTTTTTSSSSTVPQNMTANGIVEKVVLPTKVVELPTAIHEEIRVEKVKEVQPIVNVERDFTQVIQKTQPILDKEIKSVNIQNRTLDTQVLPELRMQDKGVAQAREVSSVQYLDTKAVTVEKPTIYNEVDKTQIIEEIQPVIYKETIVPQVTKETAPSFQKIVEGTTYTNERLATVDLGVKGTAYVPDNVVPKGVTVAEQLPTQRIELPTAVHEQIRQEKVTEIQPVVNVEKDFTHVIQKTQPLMDKEIKAVQIEQRTLPTQVLPQVNVASKSVGIQRDVSTVDYLQEKNIVIEKQAIYNEIDKTRIIEEIQPVIYKETIVPEVIKETQPVFQKIIEGTTYSSEVLPPMQLHGSNYHYPTQVVQTQVVQPVVVQKTVVVEQPIVKPVPVVKPVHTEKLVQETTTTVTQVTENQPNLVKATK